jgi:ribonuclease R
LSTRKTSLRLKDPYLERERERYAQPIPSREFVLQIMAERGVPLDVDELVRMLDLYDDEIDLFNRRLQAMEREGQIIRNRRGALCLPEKIDLIRGRVEGHPDGFGFLVPEAGGEHYFLGPKELHKVLHGDIVLGRMIGLDRRGRPEATVVEVLQHVNRQVVGRLFEEHGVLFVVAENKRINQDLLVAPASDGGARPGQVVVAEILSQPRKHSEPVVRVVEVLGNYADPGMEIEIALRKHDLPWRFTEAAEKIARKLPKGVRKKDLEGREDLRDLPLVTIDGETARDFDDAVYCERQGRGFRLLVAIADVSHYVTPGDALDVESRERGNSVYFPRRVIPMLPEELSNGLCSLNPDVDRLCVACEMTISSTGAIRDYRFFPAVMHSRARLTYTEVAAILADPKGSEARARADLVPALQNLERVFGALLKARTVRGAIDFETTETRMIFDDQGKIEQIVPVKRNDAHRLIEECMLAANVSASDFLKTSGHAALYRVHPGPTEERLDALREFLREFGLSLSGGDAPHASDYAKLLASIKSRPDAELLQTVMLRSLQQAVYSPKNVGHFGLAYETYTHFTSPIRRYPDLLIHRAIKAVLKGETYAPGDWATIAQHCSQTERRADEATRDVEAWLKCFYMRDRIGEVFDGTVSAVVGFGMFVALDEVYVEGLVHISELGHDYFHFDAARHRLQGERTGTSFRLADRVKVKLVRVDLETNKIDFALVSPSVQGEAPRPARGGPRKGGRS